MELVAAYPIVVTDKLRECREFHARWFGLEVIFEADWIAVLSAGGGVPTIAFMHSRHPSTPPSPGPHECDGMFLTLQVADAAGEFERLISAGMRFDLELRDEPWGQRRFGVVDPSGMWVDVVEQIEPAPGWWEPYLS
jgi:catechol 2,3-dioxygenase-like lactoylglutathione lyase family enzyme